MSKDKEGRQIHFASYNLQKAKKIEESKPLGRSTWLKCGSSSKFEKTENQIHSKVIGKIKKQCVINAKKNKQPRSLAIGDMN